MRSPSNRKLEVEAREVAAADAVSRAAGIALRAGQHAQPNWATLATDVAGVAGGRADGAVGSVGLAAPDRPCRRGGWADAIQHFRTSGVAAHGVRALRGAGRHRRRRRCRGRRWRRGGNRLALEAETGVEARVVAAADAVSRAPGVARRTRQHSHANLAALATDAAGVLGRAADVAVGGVDLATPNPAAHRIGETGAIEDLEAADVTAHGVGALAHGRRNAAAGAWRWNLRQCERRQQHEDGEDQMTRDRCARPARAASQVANAYSFNKRLKSRHGVAPRQFRQLSSSTLATRSQYVTFPTCEV